MAMMADAFPADFRAAGKRRRTQAPSDLYSAKFHAAERLRRAADNAQAERPAPVGHDVYAPTPLGRVPSRNNDAHIVPDPTSTAAPTDTRSVTQPPYDASAPTPATPFTHSSVPFARSPAADPAAAFTHSSGKLPVAEVRAADPFAGAETYADYQAAIAQNYKAQTADLAGSRLGRTLAGGVETAGAGYVNAAGTVNDYLNQYYAAPTAFRPDGTVDWEASVKAHRPSQTVQEATDALYAGADALRSRGAQHITEAKDGLGWLGQRLVDAGASGVQMLGDAALNALAPGAGLAAMGVRAFGSAAGDARRDGADVGRQVLYGLANAAVEALTEKLTDIPGVYGGGWLDDAAKKVVDKWIASPVLKYAAKAAASAAGESLEEAAAGLVEPGLRSIYNGKGFARSYEPEDWADMGNAAFSAAILGALGGLSPNAQATQAQTEAAARPELSQTEAPKRADPAKTAGNEETVSQRETVISREMLMTETEEAKAERLKNAWLKVTEAKEGSGNSFDLPALKKVSFIDAGRILAPILQKLGITGRSYFNQPLEVTFDYTNNGARRSAAHQWNETEGDYRGFAVVQENLEGLSQNAYPLEMHVDEKPKTKDSHVTQVATLGSILHTDEGYIPVRMTIKFFDNEDPKLHVIINGDTLVQEAWTHETHNATGDISAKITIPEFFNLVKESNEFGKRIPESIKNRGNPSALPPTLSAALEALRALGDTPAGRRARSAAEAAAQAFRYIREAAQRSDEAAYATALGVLRHSAKELSDLAASGALPEDAVRAANHVAAEIKTLPGKAMDLPAVSADAAQADGNAPQPAPEPAPIQLERSGQMQYNQNSQNSEQTKEETPNGAGADLLHGSGERTDGARAAEQAESLAEAAGRDQGGNESGQTAAARPADAGAADLTVGEKISTASLGLPDGSTADAIYEVIGGDTSCTKRARQIAADRGLNLHLFTGGNLHFDTSGEARGYISGKDVYVRADHPRFTSDQIVRHEVGHDMIDRGEIDPDTVRRRVARLYGGKRIRAVAELYACAYDGMSADDAWTEIICDSIGGMNIFSGREESLAGPYQAVLNDVKASAENSQTKERGPPGEQGKASRENRAQRGRSIELETMENNRFERLRQFHADLPAVWYAYTRDYIYVYSNQSFMDYTILHRIPLVESTKEDISDMLEAIRNGTYKSAKTFDRWAAHFRSGRGSDSLHSNGSENSGAAGSNDGMDV